MSEGKKAPKSGTYTDKAGNTFRIAEGDPLPDDVEFEADPASPETQETLPEAPREGSAPPDTRAKPKPENR